MRKRNLFFENDEAKEEKEVLDNTGKDSSEEKEVANTNIPDSEEKVSDIEKVEAEPIEPVEVVLSGIADFDNFETKLNDLVSEYGGTVKITEENRPLLILHHHRVPGVRSGGLIESLSNKPFISKLILESYGYEVSIIAGKLKVK